MRDSICMVKVLLVYEDFNEMSATINYLKKVGFDVLGINNELGMNDQFLHFNPNVVVAYGKNVRVSSLSVGRKLRDHPRFSGQVVLVLPAGHRPTAEEMLKIRMDAVVDAPVLPEKLIQVLSRLSGSNASDKIDKFARKLSEAEKEELIHVKSTQLHTEDATGQRPKLVDAERIKRYQNFTDSIELKEQSTSHQRQDVKKAQKDIKKDWNFDKLEEQDELRRQFAYALFKKR